MKKKIRIIEEDGYRWRIITVKRKEYNYIITEKIAKLRRQNEPETPQGLAP